MTTTAMMSDDELLEENRYYEEYEEFYGLELDEEHDEHEWDVLDTIQDFNLHGDDTGGDYSTMGFSLGAAPQRAILSLGDCHPTGSTTSSHVSAPVSLLVESLVQQLCTLLEKETGRSRQIYDTVCERLEQMKLINSSWRMGEFDVMRQQYQNALYQLVQVSKEPDMILPSAPAADRGVIWPLPQPVSKEWSRYHKEFEELAFIAGGGFGKVYRARNKLDGIVYAVKKVIIRDTSINKIMGHLSEVKTLASLHHVNIVPYKASWLEPLMVDKSDGVGDEEAEEEEESDFRSSEIVESRISTRRTTVSRREEFSDSVVFQNSNEGSSKAKTELLWTESVSNTQMSYEANTAEAASKAVCHYKKVAQPHLKLNWAVLYIQMAECHLTLRTWLDDRNKAPSFTAFYRSFLASGLEKNRSTSSVPLTVDQSLVEEVETPCHLTVVSDVFLQLINGLSYIHARSITHHDIKPSNIFISVDHDSNIIVQLGDFGLACPLQSTHEKAMGTPQYAAPEQLKGQCDPRSDIYSLGVILLELLACFNTDTERIKTVAAVKRGVFPDEVPSQFRDLITRLLSDKVEDRPPAFELPDIFNRLCRSRDPIVEDLQKKLVTQDQQIAHLKELMESQHKETASLHKNLEQEVQNRAEELSKKDETILSLQRQLAQLQCRMESSQRHIKAKHSETKKLKKRLEQNKGSVTDSSS